MCRLAIPMPIGLEEWRASVGSNNAARSSAFNKIMSSTEGMRFSSNNGKTLVAYYCID